MLKLQKKSIQYPGRSKRFSDEDNELMKKSREEIKQTYGYKDIYVDY